MLNNVERYTIYDRWKAIQKNLQSIVLQHDRWFVNWDYLTHEKRAKKVKKKQTKKWQSSLTVFAIPSTGTLHCLFASSIAVRVHRPHRLLLCPMKQKPNARESRNNIEFVNHKSNPIRLKRCFQYRYRRCAVV